MDTGSAPSHRVKRSTLIVAALAAIALLCAIAVVNRSTSHASIVAVNADSTATDAALPPTPTCDNSTNSNCGAFHWYPTPKALSAMDIAVKAPASEKVGQPVSFEVSAHDDHEAIDTKCVDVAYGDDLFEPKTCQSGVCAPRYGAWETPTDRPDDFATVYQHAYSKPGTYEVTVHLATSPSVCGSPYQNEGTTTITMTIQ